MSEVQQVYLPDEIESAKKRLAEIRFDCLVRMYDFAKQGTKGGVLQQIKPKPPQWFKSEARLSLELIKYGTEQEIGRLVKGMFIELEDRIRQIENQI